METLILLPLLAIVAFLAWLVDRLLRVGQLLRRVDALERQLAELKMPSSKPVQTQRQAPPVMQALPPVPPPASVHVQSDAPAPHALPSGLPGDISAITVSLPPAATDQSGSSLWKRLMGGNPVVRIGMVVFLIGIAFLVHLVSQAGLFPPGARLAAATFLGIGLLILGWRFRISRPQFAFPLQGGAVGTLFLVLFASYRIYALLPSSLVLPVAALLTVLAAVLAVLQSSQALAFLGLATGFAAPIALSDGSGSHIGLFSWYLILDAAVFAVAWLRSWRYLHVVAFLATYGVAAAWGVLSFSSEHWLSCEVFLIAFHLLFHGTALAFAGRTYQGLRGFVDGALVFGLPLSTFALQVGIVEGNAMSLAWTAVAVSLLDLASAWWVITWVRQGRQHLRALGESFGVLGTLFVSLAVPLAFSGESTALAWAMEGCGLVWLGLRQSRVWSFVIGVGLVLLGSGIVAFGNHFPDVPGIAVTVLALWAVAWLLDAFPKRLPLPGWLSFVPMALSWLQLVSMSQWIADEHVWIVGEERLAGGLLAVSGSALLVAAATLLGWVRGSWMMWGSLLQWFLLVLAGLLSPLHFEAAPYWHSWLGWGLYLGVPLALAGVLGIVWRGRGIPSGVFAWMIGLWWYGTLCVLSLQAGWLFHGMESSWEQSMPFLVSSLILLFISRTPLHSWKALQVSPSLWAGFGLLPWSVVLLLWMVASLFSSAASSPLPWIPILNPVDVSAFAAVFALALVPDGFWKALKQNGLRMRVLLPMVFALIWFGSTAARVVHHYGEVPWILDDLWNTRQLQSAWSLLLTAEALVLTWIAARKGVRPLWIAGASLLALAVLKLFFVDLSGSGTVARIVSFLGTGALMLGIGWLSPLPPARKEMH